MSQINKILDMNGARLIALLLVPLILGLAGPNVFAQEFLLPSQDLTQWADSADLRTIPVDKDFTSEEEVYPLPQQGEIIGLGLTGSVELKSASSLVHESY
jgi:hypothetical protein